MCMVSSMKQVFLNYSINSILSQHHDYDETKIAELKYGLEGFYIMITKAIVIFSLAIILGIFKEMILLLFFFNILRSTGFGLHASKSGICLFASSSIFLLLPFVAKIIIIPLYIKDILGIISIILIYLYAPSDTKKRPLVNKKKRTIYKLITTTNCIILVFISLIIKNEIISNLILFGIYIEIFLILPIVYKIFHLSYNNYITYNLENNLH